MHLLIVKTLVIFHFLFQEVLFGDLILIIYHHDLLLIVQFYVHSLVVIERFYHYELLLIVQFYHHVLNLIGQSFHHDLNWIVQFFHYVLNLIGQFFQHIPIQFVLSHLYNILLVIYIIQFDHYNKYFVVLIQIFGG